MSDDNVFGAQEKQKRDPDTYEMPIRKKRESGENSNNKKPVSNEIPISKKPEYSDDELGSGEVLYVESNIQNHLIGNSVKRDYVKGNEGTAGDPCNTNEEHVVQTSYGCVKGYIWQETSEIIGFIDIPYGKIEGPFEAPVPSQSWIDLHDVVNHTKRCPQLQNEDYIGVTDCLTLTIFKPKNAGNVSVLFHIYDALSNSKSADPAIYGPDYIVPKGVILVLPNYRVGPMGFLCMQNKTAPGNAALKDLSLALEWVKNNIHFFGGNPENIVVSGDGAAGAYAGYLALGSRSRYYIDKVITESGSALSHLALDRDPIGTAYTLAEKIRSEHSNGIIYNNTFEEVELEIIIKSAKGMRLSPCIEHGIEPFMNDTPWKMVQDAEIDTTFMIGSASYAGAHEALDTTDDFLDELNTNFSQFLPEDLVFKNDRERVKIALELKKQYFKEEKINSSHLEELSLWYTDTSYLGPGIRLARPLLKAGATVYLYEFSFVGSLNRELVALSKVMPGAVRSDILGYIFHKDETTVVDKSPEKRMINLMVDLWVSFIKDGYDFIYVKEDGHFATVSPIAIIYMLKK